jgi:hypothetical protein
MARGRKPKRLTLDPKAERTLAGEGWTTISGAASGTPWEEGAIVTGTMGTIEGTGLFNDDGSEAMLVNIHDTGNGDVQMRCPVGLKSRLERISEGDEIRIECLGKVRTRAGYNAWAFDVKAKPQHGVKAARPINRNGDAPKARKRPKAKAAAAK